MCSACLLACSGFEPDFGAPAPTSSAGLAGWSYDAGVEPVPEGPAGRGASLAPPAGAGSSAGKPPPLHADDAGEGGTDFATGGIAGSTGGAAGSLSRGGASGSAAAAGSGASSTGAGGAGSGQGGTGNGHAGSGVFGGNAGSAPPEGGAGSTGGAGGTAGNEKPPVHALSLSEYVEGSASFKAVELRALEASTLDGCRLATYFNGASSPSNLALSGALAAGTAYVLCTSSLASSLGSVCDRVANLSFNGDDALVLECDGVVLDSIGQVGFDPGSAWKSGDASTLNRTLRRRCGIDAGDREIGDSFDPDGEWASLPEDTFDGLGDVACAMSIPDDEGQGGQGGASGGAG